MATTTIITDMDVMERFISWLIKKPTTSDTFRIDATYLAPGEMSRIAAEHGIKLRFDSTGARHTRHGSLYSMVMRNEGVLAVPDGHAPVSDPAKSIDAPPADKMLRVGSVKRKGVA